MISTFSPNCKFPDHSVNYVGAPPLRSTLNIVWPCVLTLIASIYSALHLDVMADKAATSAEPCGCKWCKRLKWNRVCRSVRSLSLGLAISAIALFAPELIVQRALVEWQECSGKLYSFKASDIIKPEIKPQWTRTHSRYMRMGGFRLRCRGPLSRHEASPCDCEEIALDEDCILFAIACGLLPQEPPVTSQEISDQSKTSLFAKVIAIWQIVYFIADLVTRLVRRLPVSQLEVGVAAFGMLAIATLCAYFDKPKGVSIGTRVSFQLSSSLEVQEQEGAQENPKKTQENPKETQENPKETLENLKKTLEYLKGQKKEIYFKSLKDALAKRGNSFESRSRSFHRELASQIFLESDIDDMQGAFWMAATAAGIFALPFGAVHVAAWNASFPTVADLWLWRISSLISMVILLSSAGIMVLATTLCKEKFPDPVINVLVTVIYSFAALYTLARVILIVEMVRCMLFLPPEAFVTTWTANIPHLG